MRRRLSLDVADAFVGDRGVGNGVRYRAMAHECLQRPCIRLHEPSLRSQQHGFCLNATKTPLHQVIACGHSVSLRSERMVRERPSFVDAEGRTFGMGKP